MTINISVLEEFHAILVCCTKNVDLDMLLVGTGGWSQSERTVWKVPNVEIKEDIQSKVNFLYTGIQK